MNDSGLVFEWDDANRDHIAPHQVTPEEAEQVIDNDFARYRSRTVDDEQVVTTFRDSRIRVVTAFPAPRTLIHLYPMHTGN